MHLQQASERDIVEDEGAGGCLVAEEVHRAAKLPKPLLQKFSEKDDVELSGHV